MTVNKDKMVEMITEEIQKSDIWPAIKNDRDFERRVKELASDVVVDLFRVLWQHNSLFKNLGK